MIRKADFSDLESFLKLNREIQSLHSEALPRLFKPAEEMEINTARFESMISNQNTWIFMAEENGTPIGYIFCEIVEHKSNPVFHDHKKVYINHIGVSKQVKKRGIGTSLLKYVLKKAHDENINRVELDVWNFNAAAKSFFKKNGFSVFNERMAIDSSNQ